MFVFVRAVTYATLFIGLVLVYVPARLLSWSGIVRPAAIQVQQVIGMVIGAAGSAVALWCIFTFASVGRGTPAPFDPPRRLVILGPYRFWVMLPSSFSQRTSSWCGTRSPLYDEPSVKSTKPIATGSGDGGRAY